METVLTTQFLRLLCICRRRRRCRRCHCRRCSFAPAELYRCCHLLVCLATRTRQLKFSLTIRPRQAGIADGGPMRPTEQEHTDCCTSYYAEDDDRDAQETSHMASGVELAALYPRGPPSEHGSAAGRPDHPFYRPPAPTNYNAAEGL
jgi:hypothetical protein